MQLNLPRYMGTWYEVRRSDNAFQGKCVDNAVAEYTLYPDGFVRIVNRCATRAGASSVRGWGWPADESSAKLRVSFLPLPRSVLSCMPFAYGEYNVVYVDEQYTLAVVRSGPLWWVLARKADVSSRVVDGLVRQHVLQGVCTPRSK